MTNEKDMSMVKKWIGLITKEEKTHDPFRKQAEDAERDFFDDRKDGKRQLFNIFFSTVHTLQSRLYSKAPAPDVRRRYEMPGPMGQAAKQAAMLVERSLGFTVDTTPMH